jgi:regulator of nucleoside diphosphate kinase
MTYQVESRPKPAIIASDMDHKRLTALAAAAWERLPEVAEELEAEMDRAQVVPAGTVPADVVQMGSIIEFRSDTAPPRRVTLVFPNEADIAEGRISILTPIGTALIGLSPGQSINWTSRDGQRHELTIMSVEPPASRAAG